MRFLGPEMLTCLHIEVDALFLSSLRCAILSVTVFFPFRSEHECLCQVRPRIPSYVYVIVGLSSPGLIVSIFTVERSFNVYSSNDPHGFLICLNSILLGSTFTLKHL